MQLVYTEEQRLIAKSAAELVTQRSPVERFRQLRDARDPVGFSRSLWTTMAELGWLGMHLPQADGGLGLGYVELAIVMEAAGRGLMPEPLLSTAVLGAETLVAAGSDAQKRRWLEPLIAGEAIVTLAHGEARTRYDLSAVDTTATATAGDGWRLQGRKVHVPDGHVADALLVSAGTASGLSLFVVEPSQPGVAIERQTRVDHRNAAIVTLSGVTVGAEALVGVADEALPVLERVTDRACVVLAAELLGLASEAFARTLAYLKERVQFGVAIGSFQALQHRAAKLYTELELARSTVRAAAWTVDHAPDELPQRASLAKALAGECAMHMANEAIQMHGGIGMTDEHDIGFFLKRARAADATFGDANHHQARWARLRGY